MKPVDESLDELCINTIRFLAVDAVEKAKSGHPGAPMGMAAMAHVLWSRFLKHNPKDLNWHDRDRFILSAGHASALLYALLHLHGYDLSLDDLMQFRQWQSKTPGHPEYGIVPGVETTTGPLGQGFANGVGMAIAERRLAARYNRPGCEIINHHTYGIVSDGDLQEGVSAEAASLAGHLQLGKIIYLYDSNDISIEGNNSLAFSENVAMRFHAYGWQVIGPIDGLDVTSIASAITKARRDRKKPSLIICRTVIGYGSPNRAGTPKAHGEPLGEEETLLTKQNLGWNSEEPFTVPAEVYAFLAEISQENERKQQHWLKKYQSYHKKHPRLAKQLEQDFTGELVTGWDKGLSALFDNTDKPMATRDASGQVLNSIAEKIPSLFGGSADLAPSNKTLITGGSDFSAANYTGHNFHFGIREQAMGAIANGMALHGGIIPYTATFLVFYDYMRPPVRLAALMGTRVIYVYTHDSIGVGEDGPTHQPIEQIIGLRSVPGLVTIRPADASETAIAWQIALERKQGPTALVLTRQKLPVLDRNLVAPSDGVRKGGYVLWESKSPTQIILIGTGSELHIALAAGKQLAENGIGARVVSLPSWELFEDQPQEYQNQVLPQNIKTRVSIEAATTLGWQKYVGQEGIAIGIDHFGASAPGGLLYEKFGFTVEHALNEAKKLLGK